MKNKIDIKIKTVEHIVNEWFLKTIHQTIIQQDTALHAKFHTAKDELIKLLGIREQSVNEQPTNQEIK